jgi:hypothetical protein
MADPNPTPATAQSPKPKHGPLLPFDLQYSSTHPFSAIPTYPQAHTSILARFGISYLFFSFLLFSFQRRGFWKKKNFRKLF